MGQKPDQGTWEREVGLKEETTYVAIYPSRTRAETWMDEADEKGYRSRSRYLIELIQEARAKREGLLSASEPQDKRIEELSNEIEELETKLKAARKSPTSEVDVVDRVDVGQHLTDRFQPLDSIIDEALNSDAIRDRVQQIVEDELFDLASNNESEYKSGHGWRLVSDVEGEQ